MFGRQLLGLQLSGLDPVEAYLPTVNFCLDFGKDIDTGDRSIRAEPRQSMEIRGVPDRTANVVIGNRI